MQSKEVGTRIKQVMKAKGLKLIKIADLFGIDQSTVSRKLSRNDSIWPIQDIILLGTYFESVGIDPYQVWPNWERLKNTEVSVKAQKSLNRKLYELVSLHTARRTFVSIMSFRGLTAKEISLMTGHKQTSIVDIYDKTKAHENAIKILSKFNPLS